MTKLFEAIRLSVLCLLVLTTGATRPHETKITSVGDELMKLSPALRENYAAYKQCAHSMLVCDTDPIFQERDRLVAQLFPRALPQLAEPNNWSVEAKDSVEYLKIQADLAAMRTNPDPASCQMMLDYFWRLSGGILRTGYRFRRILCDSSGHEPSASTLTSSPRKRGLAFLSLF